MQHKKSSFPAVKQQARGYLEELQLSSVLQDFSKQTPEFSVVWADSKGLPACIILHKPSPSLPNMDLKGEYIIWA